MKEFKEILAGVVRKLAVGSSHALLFSGGTDSLTVLWSLLDAGILPRCYTFKLEWVDSDDYRAATRAAEQWGVEHVVVAVPRRAVPELASVIGQVVNIIGSSRKTHVEVMWPIWELLQVVGEDTVWTGLQADTLYGSGKRIKIECRNDPDRFRMIRETQIADPLQEGFEQFGRLCSHFGKKMAAPYISEEVRRYMLGFSWVQLNRPKQKMPAVVAFEDRFKEIPIYRRNDNLQCGSGVREYARTLLVDPSVNPRGWRSMKKVYEDLGRLS